MPSEQPEKEPQTNEVYDISMRDRWHMAVGLGGLALALTLVVSGLLYLVPVPLSDAIAGFTFFLGFVITVGLVAGSFFAPAKEVPE